MSVLLEFAMFPTDQGESVSAYVSRVIEMIRETGIPYQLTPMGTILETDTLEQALAVIQQAGALLDEAGCNRIYSSLKLDIRKGKSNRLRGKVASIQERIGEVAT